MSNPMTPKFPVLNGVNIYDPSIYKLTKTVLADDHTSELDLEGAASLARSYVAGLHPGSFEIGGKVRSGDKSNTTNEPVYVATGSPVLQYSQVLGNVTDPNFYFSQYKLPPLSDYKKILALIAANPGAVILDVDQTRSRSDPNNYQTTERVYAFYAMNTITFGRARLQAGVRVETTQSHFTGYKVAFGTVPNASGFLYQSTTPVPGHNLYANVLPSVQFQYAMTPSANLRASYGRGIARPNFSDLPPYILESGTDQTVSIGNPALKPTGANNYDLLIEKYLKPYGIIQAGFFYKTLSNPIVSENTTLSANDPVYPGYTQTQPVNIPDAHILGLEASLQQRLSFLPGAGGGLGVSTNYSYTTSQASFPAVYGRTDHPALMRQGPNNWNTDVTYDKGRISGRLGVTHNDAYIYQYNYLDGVDLGLTGPNGDIYTYAHTQVDAQTSFRLKDGLKFVASFLNMNNEVFGFYQGSPQFPTQREFYRPTYSFGLRWSSSKE
jgi:TonB-dependent receptor